MATSIEKLARAMDPVLSGVDWDKLTKLFNLTPEEIVYNVEDKSHGDVPVWQYQTDMKAAYAKAKSYVDQINLPWEIGTTDALLAWNKVKDAAVGPSESALKAMDSKISVLPIANAFHISSNDLSATVASMYISSMYSLVMHQNLILQRNLVDAHEIVDNADDITKAFNAISYLFESGALDALKKNQVKGLGLPVIVGVIIVIAAVAAIGAIAWTMVATKKIASFNKQMDAVCGEAIKTKDKDLLDACLKLADMSKVATDGGPTNFGPMGEIQKLLWAGLGAYLIFLAAPYAVPAVARALEKRKPA